MPTNHDVDTVELVLDVYASTSMYGLEIVDEEARVVGGYFTDDGVDEYGYMINADAMRNAVEEYLKWGNIRNMHREPVGLVVDVPGRERPWNYVYARIVDDDVWAKVMAGVYKGFSIGAMVFDSRHVPVDRVPVTKFDGVSKAVVDAVMKRGYVIELTDLALYEISIVDRPANPRATVARRTFMLPAGMLHEKGVNPMPKNKSQDEVLAAAEVEAKADADTQVQEQDSTEPEAATVEDSADGAAPTEGRLTVENSTGTLTVDSAVNVRYAAEFVTAAAAVAEAAIKAAMPMLVETVEDAVTATLEKVGAADDEPMLTDADIERIVAAVQKAMGSDAEREATVNQTEEDVEEEAIQVDAAALDFRKLTRAVAIKIAQGGV